MTRPAATLQSACATANLQACRAFANVTFRRAKGPERCPSVKIVLLADCPALWVGEMRISAGSSEVLEALGGSAALLFTHGEGRAVISGCSHTVREGSVEVVCPGEQCTISAARDVHAYVVVAKDSDRAYR